MGQSAESPVWNVPHQRNLFFKGREAILAAIDKALTTEGSAAIAQAISGLGGIGKTQTAVEYAYTWRHRSISRRSSTCPRRTTS